MLSSLLPTSVNCRVLKRLAVAVWPASRCFTEGTAFRGQLGPTVCWVHSEELRKLRPFAVAHGARGRSCNIGAHTQPMWSYPPTHLIKRGKRLRVQASHPDGHHRGCGRKRSRTNLASSGKAVPQTQRPTGTTEEGLTLTLELKAVMVGSHVLGQCLSWQTAWAPGQRLLLRESVTVNYPVPAYRKKRVSDILL